MRKCLGSTGDFVTNTIVQYYPSFFKRPFPQLLKHSTLPIKERCLLLAIMISAYKDLNLQSQDSLLRRVVQPILVILNQIKKISRSKRRRMGAEWFKSILQCFQREQFRPSVIHFAVSSQRLKSLKYITTRL